MADNEQIVDNILKLEQEIVESNENAVEFAAGQITILEAEKAKFQEPAKILDLALFNQVKEVNQKRDDLTEFYEGQISLNRRSDLFWRVTGIGSDAIGNYEYKVRCEKLSALYDPVENQTSLINKVAGFTTNSVMKYDPSLPFPHLETINMSLNEEGKLDSSGSDFETSGVSIAENKDALKLYTEPYTIDTFDTLRGESYGVVDDANPNIIILLTPINVNQVGIDNTVNPLSGISPGDFVTVDPEGAFSTPNGGSVIESVVILNNFDFDEYEPVLGLGVGVGQAYQITVADSANPGFTTVTSTGNYPLFTISQNPDTISEYNFAETFENSPYNPQTIRIVKKKKTIDGNGIKIERTFEGYNKDFATWNKDLLGFPDPENLETTVEEPLVSNGKQIYPIGYTDKPQNNSSDVSEGTSVTVTGISLVDLTTNLTTQVTYTAVPNSGSFDTAGETAATNAKDTAVTAWRTSSVVDSRIELSNILKNEINELNIQVWGFRLQIGQAQTNIASKQSIQATIEQSNLIQLLEDAEAEL